MAPPVSVAIVGLGQIGLTYDLDPSVPAGAVYTHARALTSEPGFRLVGGVDIQEDARSRLEKSYSVKSYSTLPELIETEGCPEWVVVSVPTQYLVDAARLALGFPIKGLVVEKPVSHDPDEISELSSLSAGRPILANYFRRGLQQIRDIREAIASGKLGALKFGTCHFSGGVYNNASHFIDLLRYLSGEISRVSDAEFLGSGAFDDFHANFTVAAGADSAQVTFYNVPREARGYFQLRLIYENGLVEVVDGGRSARYSLWRDLPSPLVDLEDRVGSKNELRSYQADFYRILSKSFKTDGPLSSGLATIEDAHRVIQTIQEIKDLCQN